MSDTKNAFLRYQILDECFSNVHRKYYLDDLISLCSQKLSDYYGQPISVSKRTIQYDIDFMRGSGGNFAPIEGYKDGRKTFYRYSDPMFSFMKKELDNQERNVLRDALITMSRIKGIPGFDWVNEMQVQLKSALDLNINSREIISFEGNEYLRGIEFLHQLYNLISAEKAIKIGYHPFSDEMPSQLIISPYYLKEYNNRWFLIGWNNNEDYLQTLALDRFTELEETGVRFIATQINFKKYFNEIIGVTNYLNEPIEKVEINLSDNIIPYIETKPLHEEQWLEGNILTLNVKLNYELVALILSFGENMKVISPEKLVEKIKFRLKEAVHNY